LPWSRLRGLGEYWRSFGRAGGSIKGRRAQSPGPGSIGYPKEVKNMAQAPESWIGETVDVAFYQQANRSGKLLEVNDDGIVLEEVSERDVEVTLHTFYPWNTLNYVRKEVRSAEGITPRRRGT
jgi:hypothetical protein